MSRPLPGDPEESRFQSALDCAREIAETVITPRAIETDLAAGPPIDNIRALAAAGLMGLTTPAEFGGIGAPGRILRQYTEIQSAACGVTSFIQGQHQSAALLIATGENPALKEMMLPGMARGDILCGVAFSHLRRPGPPILRVEPKDEGWVFNGTAPWFTGWPLIRETVLGGTLPDGRLLWVVAALTENEGLSVSPPMRLCAMNASGTVSLNFREFYVLPERYLKTITREQMAKNDAAAILAVTPQPFGVTVACLRLLDSLGRNRNSIHAVHESMSNALNTIREQSEFWIDRTTDPAYKPTALRIRAHAIALGVRAAHAAVAASGGGANGLEHPAQRLFREAMFYTLAAQTPDVQTATLDLLTV